MDNKNSIVYMDYYIPPNYMSVDDVLSLNNDTISISGIDQCLFKQNFKSQSRINRIAFFNNSDQITAIATEMVEKLFHVTGINPAEIRYLVCGNPVLMNDDVSTIHYIYEHFKIKNSVILPIFQPCTSSMLSMGLAGSLLRSNDTEVNDGYMLIISACKYQDIKSRFVGFTVMGDGLSIVLIKNNTGHINIKDWYTTNNAKSSYKKLKSGKNGTSISQLKTSIISNGVSFIKNYLSEKQLRLKDIDIIIHPNTYYDVWHKIYTSMLDIEESKFYLANIADGGHMNDVDLIRNLKDFLIHNQDKKNIDILMYGIDLVKSYDINYHLLHIEAINN